MSDQRNTGEIYTDGLGYLSWRGELLAELALVRVPGLIVHKRPTQPPPDLPYDFLVATEQGGFCFFVEVKAFSSSRLGIVDVEAVGELRWSVDASLVRSARQSHNPVLLFLFDADTDHGRYIRLDKLPDPGSQARRVTVRFPVEHTIGREVLEKLIAELQAKAA